MSDVAGSGEPQQNSPKGGWAWLSGATGHLEEWLEKRRLLVIVAFTAVLLGGAFLTGGAIRTISAGPFQIDLAGAKPPSDLGDGQPLAECQQVDRMVEERISASEVPLTVGRTAILSADVTHKNPQLEGEALEYFFEVHPMLGEIDSIGWTDNSQRSFVPKTAGQVTVVVLTRTHKGTIVGCERCRLELR
jgi:hypothetical protein